MDLNPPEGSKILISNDGSEPTIVIPQPGGVARYFSGLFLLFWLGAWTIGFKFAFTQIMSGQAPAFLVFWLGAWTIGGCFAVLMAYRSLRPTVPETLALGRSSIAYDSGVTPPQFNNGGGFGRSRSFQDTWAMLFPKRTQVELTQKQLQSLRLREGDAANRLTVDVDAERIDLASRASEVEREWLARYLARRYNLSQVQAAPPS